jgi:RNA polymerase sigma factor (sigma-70 family)
MRATVTRQPDSSVDPIFLALLARARTRESAALEGLFTRFYERVQADVHRRLSRDVRISRPWLKSRFSTGDVVQEVFRSVLGDLDTFGGTSEDAFSGWLAIVVRNRIVDSIRFHEADCRDGRKGLSMPEDEEQLGPHDGTDPLAAAARQEELLRLDEALAELEPKIRLLVRARAEDLASFQELAEQLGCGSESAARRAYFAAQARLALRLKDRRAPGRNPS